jgi:heat shock factor-binding protein 1
MVSRQTGIGGRTAQALGWRREAALFLLELARHQLSSRRARVFPCTLTAGCVLVLTLSVAVVHVCLLRVQAESPNNPSASPLSSGPAAPNVGEAQSAQDLTLFVQNLLQQMQTRFQTMSNAIIGRSQCKHTRAIGQAAAADGRAESLSVSLLFELISTLLLLALVFTLSLTSSSFAVDEMGGRIDDLEKSIGELMAQAGIEEEADKAAAAAAAAKSNGGGGAPAAE